MTWLDSNLPKQVYTRKEKKNVIILHWHLMSKQSHVWHLFVFCNTFLIYKHSCSHIHTCPCSCQAQTGLSLRSPGGCVGGYLCHLSIWTYCTRRIICLCLLCLSQPCPAPWTEQGLEGIPCYCTSYLCRAYQHETHTLLMRHEELVLLKSVCFVCHFVDKL